MSAPALTIRDVRPWSEIPDDVVVVFAAGLPVTGFCDHASRTIWIRKGLRQRHRRAVLQHELLHLSRGVVYLHWQDHEERAVEEATARALIPIAELCDALRWTRSLHELAAELHVPPSLIRVRADTMRHPAERAAVAAVMDDLGEMVAT